MPLPEIVRVKLSSESAGAITLTPVVVQDLPLRELIGHLLPVTGKDEARILQILQRGSFVSGASRFRWTGWAADSMELAALLDSFPGPDPERPFARAQCVHAVLLAGVRSIRVPRETGRFWDSLMDLVEEAPLAYAGYSYRESADRYIRELGPREVERIRAACDALRYATLREQIRAAAFRSAELYVGRISGVR